MPRDVESNRISDRIRYEHMLAAASDVATMVSGRTRSDLDSDMVLRRALIQAIQEIGEAAARMTDAGRTVGPAIPWGAIVGMRNIVVHVYWGINLDRVWQVAVEDIPQLIPLLRAAIEQLPLPPDIQSDT